jgi:hypothetical protein
MVRILGSTGSRRRRRYQLAALFSVVALLALIAVPNALAVLTGSPSKFESGNDPTIGLGNMTVDTTGNSDWVTVADGLHPAYVHLTDVVSSGTDDSFTPGQKQDTTCPTVTGHSNPPKDDFSDIASYTETASNGDVYLYGATIRFTANGNASENIELKQGTSGFCPGSTTLLARTNGDKLLAIDYLGGGKAVQFHVLTWVTAVGAPCNVSNDVSPCWGATVVTLDGTTAEGGVNATAITAANNPISGVALVAGQFAEFGVNLTASGIIGSTACAAFAQTVWESRSSGSSFVSSTKDIVIETHPITNCGEIVIIKRSNPRGVDQNFSFTSDIAGSELTCVADSTPDSFTLNDKDANVTPPAAPHDSSGNTEDCTKVPAGTYHVTELAEPTGFAFGSLVCTTGGVRDGTTQTAIITLNPGDVVTCVYTNNQQFGAIKILKNSTKGGGAVTNAGAVFSYDNGAGSSGSVTDTTDGTLGDENTAIGAVCVSGLVAGTTYTVLETSPPAGYGGGTTLDSTADAVAGTDCTTTLPGTGGTVTYTEPPLSDLQVRFRDGGSGETSATISCESPTGTVLTPDTTGTTGWGLNPPPSGITRTYLGLTAPRTVTCTITIDP